MGAGILQSAGQAMALGLTAGEFSQTLKLYWLTYLGLSLAQ